ncbi:MAG: hypothetical protein ABIO57_02795 [Candidatus Paceibacterota bacterium]
MENENKTIVKAPHYFLVHFDEKHTSVNGGDAHGKCYTFMCDGFAVNVYGFRSDEEATAFDSLSLRGYLIGSREVSTLWEADDEESLMKAIAADKRVIDGVYQLSKYMWGSATAIENLPTCQRMHINSEGDLLCGKPEGEYGDGCFGGCVIQGYDQEKEMPDGPCPMHVYWDKRFEMQKQKVA